MTTKTKGNIGEIKVASEFIKLGYTVSFPFGDNSRYDLIVDINKKLYRVQIKYSNQLTENNSFICRCVSSKNHTTNKHLDKYTQDVDLIAFYIADLDTCIVFPIEFIKDKTAIILRNDTPKNNQTKDIHLVSDFTIEKFIKTIIV